MKSTALFRRNSHRHRQQKLSKEYWKSIEKLLKIGYNER